MAASPPENPGCPSIPKDRRQRKDPASMLSYRRLLRLGRGELDLATGSYHMVATSKSVLVYQRRQGGRTLLVALNMSGTKQPLPAPSVPVRILISTSPTARTSPRLSRNFGRTRACCRKCSHSDRPCLSLHRIDAGEVSSSGRTARHHRGPHRIRNYRSGQAKYLAPNGRDRTVRRRRCPRSRRPGADRSIQETAFKENPLRLVRRADLSPRGYSRADRLAGKTPAEPHLGAAPKGDQTCQKAGQVVMTNGRKRSLRVKRTATR
jgi:hypothetical protein